MHTLGSTVACHQGACFVAGVLFARGEGIAPAPEASPAETGAIAAALRCKREGKRKGEGKGKGKAETLLFKLCGHGHVDMAAHRCCFAGQRSGQRDSEDKRARAQSGLPSVRA